MMKNTVKFLALLLVLVLSLGTVCAEEDKEALKAQYDAAMALYENEQYEQALEAFEALGRYSDSRTWASKSKWQWRAVRYREAISLYQAESYHEALALFEELGSHEDSKKYVSKCTRAIQKQEYAQADALFDAGDYEGALAMFTALDRYDDSRERAAESAQMIEAVKKAAEEAAYYQQALEAKAAGELEKARDLFVLAGQDSAEATDELYEVLEVLALRSVYERAGADLARGQYEDALVRYEVLGDYEDSAEKAVLAREKQEAALYDRAAALETENPAMAYILFRYLEQNASVPADSAARADALKEDAGIAALYKASDDLEDEDLWAAAQVGYGLCEGYKDSEVLEKELSRDVVKKADFERAHILADLWRLEEANAIYKSLKGFKYASRMQMERLTARQLRDDATTEMSDVFTAPDGTAHTYRIYKGVFRWIEAEAFCRALGGHLATITTDEENEFVYWFMRGNDFLTAYFGLEDEERRHNWKWVTGEPVEYTNWNPGEPSYSSLTERYGMYFYKHEKGTWNDSHFYEATEFEPGCSYICEWDY